MLGRDYFYKQIISFVKEEKEVLCSKSATSNIDDRMVDCSTFLEGTFVIASQPLYKEGII